MAGTESRSDDLTTLMNQLCASFVGKDQRVYYTQPKLTRAERVRTLRIKANNVLFQQMKGPHFVRYVSIQPIYFAIFLCIRSPTNGFLFILIRLRTFFSIKWGWMATSSLDRNTEICAKIKASSLK